MLSGGALVTTRVMTVLDEAGHPEVTHATFRMSVGKSVVDNLHRGGIGSAVDVRTGELGRGTHLQPAAEWVSQHPNTRAQILGRTLPMWRDVEKLSLEAHSAFSEFVVVGWDIAVTPDGPMLVEGNSGPDVNTVQRPQDAALGDSRFAELLAYHLA